MRPYEACVLIMRGYAQVADQHRSLQLGNARLTGNLGSARTSKGNGRDAETNG